MTKMELITVNPDVAMALLQKVHPKNRPVAMNTVDQYADEMKLGKFNSLNGETIIFDDQGYLLDGQHRLWAVALSGVTLPFMAVYADGDSDEIIKTIDNGRRRSVGSFLTGVKNRNVVAGIGKIAYCIEYGSVPLLTALQGKTEPRRGPSRSDVIDYIESTSNLFEEVGKQAVSVRKAIGSGSTTMIGVALWVIRKYGNPTAINQFVEDITKTVPEAKSNIAWLGSIRKSYMNGQSLLNPELFSRVLWAYDAYMDGGTKTKTDAQKSFQKYASLIAGKKGKR